MTFNVDVVLRGREAAVTEHATLPTVEELRAHVASSLVGPKQPRMVVQVDALPRTDATGQIRRRRVRDTIVAEGLASG